MQCVFAAMPDNTINFGDHWFGAKPPAELKPGKASNPAELGGGAEFVGLYFTCKLNCKLSAAK